MVRVWWYLRFDVPVTDTVGVYVGQRPAEQRMTEIYRDISMVVNIEQYKAY